MPIDDGRKEKLIATLSDIAEVVELKDIVELGWNFHEYTVE